MPDTTRRQRKKATSTAPQFARGEHGESAELWRPGQGKAAPRGPERVLLQRGIITSEQLDEAAKRRRENPHLSILETLVATNVVDRMQALEAMAEHCDLPFQRLSAADIDAETFDLLPVQYIKAKLAIPIRRNEDAVLVGITDPVNVFLIEDLKRRLRDRVQLVVTPPEDILQAVEELSAGTIQHMEDILRDVGEHDVEVVKEKTEESLDLEKIASKSPIIRYVNYLIDSAVRDGASDIHIEPKEGSLRVRYRIDGLLFDQQPPRFGMHAGIISRLKIMANLDIAERRLPQDGRIRATIRGTTLDLRVSTIPVADGEKCVIRILDSRSVLVGLENLGMWEQTLEAFRRQILRPNGIILVTGPTGSGKTTTMYSALQVINSDVVNICTVEDPIEYKLPFANQVNARDGIGLTFAAVLRSLLRQDPDVILVGEMRDEETARITVQASLTGHLVLSTLHTNDAPSSITRMIDIGIQPYLISASVNAILSQRLVRRICENCKTPVASPKESVVAYLEGCGSDIDGLCQGAGCEKCRQTGYKGRLGIFELLEVDDDIRQLISRGATLTELRHAAGQKGMRTLRDDGLLKVAAGAVTVEELIRVTET